MTTKSLLLSDLPVELQEEIISFLPLSDRKTASLVCRLWNELAFCRRLLRNVGLSITTKLDWEQSELNYLRKSTRRYRNLFARREVFFGVVIDVLDHIGTDLEYFWSYEALNEEQLWNVVIRAPNLKQLTVLVNIWTWTRSQQQFNFPEMKYLEKIEFSNVGQMESLNYSVNVPNLTQLRLCNATGSIHVLRRYAQQLKKLELITTDSAIPFEELQLPKVEVLDMGGCILHSQSVQAVRKFFTGLQSLKELKISTSTHESTVDAITKACPGIEKWHLHPNPLTPRLFCFLQRLKHLKMLSLSIAIDLQIKLEGNPLASVQQLSLDMQTKEDMCEESIIKDFGQLLPNVTDITVKAFRASENLLLFICQSFPRLKRLWYSGINSEPLEALRYFTGLEDLSIQCINLSIGFMPPNSHLKRLKFEWSLGMTDENLLTLAELYPNLNYLELDRCNNITSKGIEAFRSVLVDCVVCKVKKYSQI